MRTANLAVKRSHLQLVKTLVEHNDRWTNMNTGTGTARDKLTATTFEWDIQLFDPTLEALYHNDDLAAKCCDEVPEQMMRQGFSVVIDDDTDAGEVVCDYLKALEAPEKIVDAMVWGRLYGGAVIFVGAIDRQDSSTPLNEEGIESIDFLTVIDKREIVPNTWYLDPTLPKFGKVETFRVIITTSSSNVPILTNNVIHETRLIFFGGARTSVRQKRSNNGWDHSVLQRVYNVLQMFAMNWQSVSQLMADASQGVFKIDGLIDSIAAGDGDVVLDRLAVTDSYRSSSRSVVVDADKEDFQRVATPFAGIPDLLDKTNARLASAFGMPVTKLFGTSPGGLNSPGDSEERSWYDEVESERKTKLKPKMARLTLLCMKAKSGPTAGKVPKKWDIHYPSLWQMTPAEQADIRLKTSTADASDIDKGILTPEEVAVSRYSGPEGYSLRTVIDPKGRQALILADESGAAGDVEEEEGDGSGANAPSILAIVQAAASGEIPRDSAIAIIMQSFPDADAEAILADIGQGFEQPKPEPPPVPAGAGAPGVPTARKVPKAGPPVKTKNAPTKRA